jgi:hypothetical protein
MLSAGADPTYLSLMDIRSRFYSIFTFEISVAKMKLRSEFTVVFTLSSKQKLRVSIFKLFIG